MATIFISYRRSDSLAHTGRLYDRLADHFGKKELFRDLDGIAAGDRFREVLDQKLRSCRVLLAVVGKKWLSARKGAKRRLDDSEDLVRLEILAALARGVVVIPVLVG